MDNNDDIRDLLALGGAINQQINASNSMIIEKGKSTIPTLDARKLMASANNRGNNPQFIPSIPDVPTSTVFSDPELQGMNIAPMAPLIPIEEAITDEMRKRGVTPRDYITSTLGVKMPIPVVAPPIPVPQQDKNQIEFGFVSKLTKNTPPTLIEYLKDEFLSMEIKLGNINAKLDKLLNKKSKG